MPTASVAVTTDQEYLQDTSTRSLLIGVSLIVLACMATWPTFPAVWLENRSHGFLAAGLVGWLLWTRRAELRHAGAPIPFFILPVAAFSLLWLAGQVMSLQVVHQFAALAMLGAFAVAMKGARMGRALAPVAAALALTLPVWEVLTWPLQLLASSVGGTIVRWLGVDAVIQDETITVEGVGQFIVADSCSGLGFFLTALTLGLTYALLFTRSVAARWRIVGLAALLSLVANWVRVVGLVLIGNATRMQSSLMQDHELFGWVIFGTAMAVFFFVAARIERRHPEESSIAAATVASAPGRLSAWIFPTAVFAALLGPAIFYGVRRLPNDIAVSERIAGIRPDGRWVELAHQDARASDGTGPAAGAAARAAWTPGFVGQSSHDVRMWVIGSDTIRVDRVVYRSEHQGAELVGAGNQIAADSLIVAQRLVGPLDDHARTVRQVVIRDGERARVVWSWYRVAGMETSSRGKAKLMSLIAFFSRQEGGEGVFVSTPCVGGDCTDAGARLFAFVTGRPLPASPKS